MRRLVTRAGAVIALSAVHIGIRLVNLADLFSAHLGRPLLRGSDSYYHVHRTALQLAHFPAGRFFDPFMAHPAGAVPEWALGFDYLWAAILFIPNSLGLSWSSIVWILPFCAIAVSVGCLVLFFFFCRRFLSLPFALAATLCFSLNMAFVSVSSVGDFDHHGVEVLGVVLLMLVLPLIGDGRSRIKLLLLAGGLVAVSWCSTLFANLALLFFGAWAVARVAQKSAPPLPEFGWFAVPFGVGVTVVCTVESIGHGAFLSLSTLSLIHAGAIGSLLLLILFSDRIRARYILVSGIVATLLILVFQPGAALWVISYIGGWNSFISNISESLPLFMTRSGFSIDDIHLYFGFLYFAFPVLFLLLRRQILHPTPSISLGAVNLWFCLALLLISLSQKRFAHLAVPGLMIMVMTWVSSRPTRMARIIGGTLATLLLLEPAVYFRQSGLPKPSPYGRLAAEISKEIEATTSDGASGIMAPPNLGSALLYFTGRPIVSNAFYYPRYLKSDLALRQIVSDDDLTAFLKAKRIAYLVAADDARYRTMLLELFGREKEAHTYSRYQYLPCSPPYLRYAYDRMACQVLSFNGLSPIRKWVFSKDPKDLMRQATLYRVY
jgi:hypothetical protein